MPPKKTNSVDLGYLGDDKLKKGKKAFEEQTNSEEWKGPSNKQLKEARKQEIDRRRTKQKNPDDKVPFSTKLIGGFLLIFMCGAGFFQFAETVYSFVVGDGITYLDVQDTARVKQVLFSGEPWLIYCVNNETRNQRMPSVLEESARGLYSSTSTQVGVLACWDKTQSGRSVAQRFKLRQSPPLSFLVANGNSPRVVNLAGVSKQEDLEKKIKPATEIKTTRIGTLKDFSKQCTSRRSCTVLGHKNAAQRDTALGMIKPLIESHRAMRVVTLDTSFWQLKLDDALLKARPPKPPKGSGRADVVCFTRDDGDENSTTHRAAFLQDLDSSSISSFLTACDRREGLVEVTKPPKIQARPTKPKVVTPPPINRAPKPSPPPPVKKQKASAKVDHVGSRANIEKDAEEDALFEAVDESEADGEDGEDDEDSSDSDEDDIEL